MKWANILLLCNVLSFSNEALWRHPSLWFWSSSGAWWWKAGWSHGKNIQLIPPLQSLSQPCHRLILWGNLPYTPRNMDNDICIKALWDQVQVNCSVSAEWSGGVWFQRRTLCMVRKMCCFSCLTWTAAQDPHSPGSLVLAHSFQCSDKT